MVLPRKGGENGPHALYYGSKSSFKDRKQGNAKQQQKKKRKPDKGCFVLLFKWTYYSQRNACYMQITRWLIDWG